MNQSERLKKAVENFNSISNEAMLDIIKIVSSDVEQTFQCERCKRHMIIEGVSTLIYFTRIKNIFLESRDADFWKKEAYSSVSELEKKIKSSSKRLDNILEFTGGKGMIRDCLFYSEIADVFSVPKRDKVEIQNEQGVLFDSESDFIDCRYIK